MKVLLIQPPLNPNVLGPGREYLPEPIALELLAANLPNHEVFLADLRISNDLGAKLRSIKPHLVGISCFAMTEIPTVKQVSSFLKEVDHDICTVVGGQHPTFVSEDFTNSNVDFIVFGETERTFCHLVNTLERGTADIGSVSGIGIMSGDKCYRTTGRLLVNNIDLLPFPDRNLISEYKREYYHKKGQYVATILTSRGCPHRCSFCSTWTFYQGTYRERCPESIYDEIESLGEKFIHFDDDTFLHNIDRSWEIVKLLSALKTERKYKFWVKPNIVAKAPELISAWVQIGMTTACIALESFRSEELKKMRKGTTREINDKAIDILKNLGIDVVPNFIISPYYDENDFDNLVDYIDDRKLQNPFFSVLTPLPGTQLYEEMRSKVVVRDPSFFDLAHPVVETYLPYDEFMNRFLGLYQRFYCDPISKQGEENSVRMPHFVEKESVERALKETKT